MALFGTAHSYSNAIIMVISTQPYRNALFKWLKIASKKSNSNQTTLNQITVLDYYTSFAKKHRVIFPRGLL